ncbi:DUF1491 family protein [Sphingomicrobium sp. B8]|uniref:DUF1491 family protein n=1 Tax=Sphingomicrobium clamense TaxID=2851013 RepID=A0ABS6V2Z5_9SPHN|nr:DUF1491 family protein [Sphingomicrobium sp. B8]
MNERLAAGVEAKALMRRIMAEGGFATVLRKGDEERGSLLLVIAEKGRHFTCLERQLQVSGAYEWSETGPGSESEMAEISQFLEKKRRNDPDLWLIELDIANGKRFVAEMTEFP